MSEAHPAAQGIGIHLPAHADPHRFEEEFTRHQCRLATLHCCVTQWLATPRGRVFTVRLRKSAAARLCPGADTLGLHRRLARSGAPAQADALERETWLALLAAPKRIDFDGLDALQAHLRVRCNIARAAEKTALAFRTDAAERPADYWVEREDVGFLLQPGVSLVDALVAATQPERTGRLYDFSCYRATEYVILLGIAQEAQRFAPGFYAQLEANARQHCIKSGRFHDVFLHEYGTLEQPVPPRFYVPGDRVWFRNPDPASSDATGYEGSWVIYMGRGRFSNFWDRDRAYTLEAKALEVFHWRHGLRRPAGGEAQIDEAVVAAAVASTRRNAVRRRGVLRRMVRYRDPGGVYREGGCIDASREFPRQIGSIALP